MRSLLADLLHLGRRFFSSLRAKPLEPGEVDAVFALLSPAEARLFWEQPVIDQRHAYEAARQILDFEAERRELAAAALMHDIGKRHARLGIPGRVAATLLKLMHVPVAGRFRTYLDHGGIGADDLRACGSADLTVQFAACHNVGRPDAFSEADWQLLLAADGERLRQPGRR